MNHKIISSIALAVAFFASAPGFAQDASAGTTGQTALTLADVLERYSPGKITSTELANQALEDAEQQRALAEAQFAKEEAVCYEKFFVTSCMDAAKDRRRAALKQLNAIEVEANAYNRRANVERRDQALRERQLKQETRAAERQNTASPASPEKAGEAPPTPQDIAEVESKSRQSTSTGDAAPARHYNTERAAERAEEQAQDGAKESTDAKKRADNIKAYAKKQQRSIERQHEIAAEKAAKEKERSAKSQ
jgi:colicin import membrane protein